MPLPPAAPAALRRPTLAADTDPEAGFSLLEVVVSVMVIGTVMAALTSFFVGANALSAQQGGSQAAVQVALEAAERIRGLRGSELAKGRDQDSTNRQWSSPATDGVAAHLATMEKAFDSTAPPLAVGAQSTAILPTTPVEVVRNGLTFNRHVYLGACWQPANGQLCGTSRVAGYLPFFRVVLAVLWPSRQCPLNTCSYVTVTLVSSSPHEPIFNPNTRPAAPRVDNPGAQSGQVGVPLAVQLNAFDGSPPLTWTSITGGLPPGLAMDASGRISGSPTAAGTYTWAAAGRDADTRPFTTPTNTWTVRARTLATGPGNQSTVSGTAVSVTATVSGGTAPHTWQATNLPPGLMIGASGVISGTPGRPAARTDYSVRVTATDSVGQTSSLTFVWTIIPRLQMDQPDAQTTAVDGAVSLQVRTTGGSGTLASCPATGLPGGLGISSTCLITGKPTVAGTFSVTVTATDSQSQTAQRTFSWTVTPKLVFEPVVRQVTLSGADTTIQLRTSGGSGTLTTCTATGLPDDVSISNSCLITGRPKGGDDGTYTVIVTATDTAGGRATTTFEWEVQ